MFCLIGGINCEPTQDDNEEVYRGNVAVVNECQTDINVVTVLSAVQYWKTELFVCPMIENEWKNWYFYVLISKFLVQSF